MHVNTCSLHAYAHNINTLCSHFGWSVHSCWSISSQCSVLLTAENHCFWMLHVGIGTCWLNCGSQCKLCMLYGVDLLLAEMSICFLIWHPKRAPNWSFWHPQGQRIHLNTGIECEFYSEILFKHNWNSVNDKHVIAFKICPLKGILPFPILSMCLKAQSITPAISWSTWFAY